MHKFYGSWEVAFSVVGGQWSMIGGRSQWSMIHELVYLTWAFFNHQLRTMRATHHNFVIAPMITKFGTCIKLDVFYTMVTKTFRRTTMT